MSSCPILRVVVFRGLTTRSLDLAFGQRTNVVGEAVDQLLFGTSSCMSTRSFLIDVGETPTFLVKGRRRAPLRSLFGVARDLGMVTGIDRQQARLYKMASKSTWKSRMLQRYCITSLA